MSHDLKDSVLLICDVWDNHYCANLRDRIEKLVPRINEFANIVRECGGKVLHCPSETVDSFYSEWPQRKAMVRPANRRFRVSEKMRQVDFSVLDTTATTGCPDVPTCEVHQNYTQQHDGICIAPEDFISDRAKEVFGFLLAHSIKRVLVCGVVSNMCIVGRPFGVCALSEWGKNPTVVSDLVEVFHSPVEYPYVTLEQAHWLALGYIHAKWCPITSCYAETRNLDQERNMQIRTNLLGHVLRQLDSKYQFDDFVETGTAGGDTTELASIVFDRVWSCDIDMKSSQRAQERLREYTETKLSVEPSPVFLERIKPELTKPTLYWLDAHWCGGAVKPVKECPLIEEIAAIGSFFLAEKPSVIIIDDANLITNPPPPPHDPAQWPTLGDVQTAFNAWQEPYDMTWHQGANSQLLVVTPKEDA